MKLGSQTNSLTNHIYSRMTIGQPDPVVGMGVTMLHWTDRDAGTIITVDKVGSAVLITVQEDWAFRADKNGMSECQDYTYQPNPTGSVYYFKQDKNGAWQGVRKNFKTNRWVKTGGAGCRIGEREKYHDYSF